MHGIGRKQLVSLLTIVIQLLGIDWAFGGEESLRQIIDAEISATWRKENVTPASASSDTEFLRRVSLDLAGIVPSYEETTAFLGDSSPDRREKLIERLLNDPRYSQHQADIWDLILFGRNPPGYNTDRRDGIQRWLNAQFAANRPYNEFVRELLVAEGNSAEQGPPLFYVQYSNQPEDLTEVITQTFLGVQLQCARCHDHPFENWTQLDFYGMAAFFSRLQVVDLGRKDDLPMIAIGEKSTGDILFTGPAKDLQPGKKGDPVKPKFLLGDSLIEPPLPEGFKEVKFEGKTPPVAPVFSRKNQFAEWITRSDNTFFARAIVNRIWAQYMGRGLVHPVDNMSEANSPSHPALLNELAKWFVEHQFDMKALIRELVSSQTYQLSSISTQGEAMPRWFEHGRTRPLSAEELAESWKVVTGYDAAMKDKPQEKRPNRFRPLTRDYVIRFFGQPNTGAGHFQGGLAEHLYLNNGELGNLFVNLPGTLLVELNKKEIPIEERVNRLFLQGLNRPASVEEQAKFIELHPNPSEENWREVLWSVMTCSEFRFNH